MSDIVRHVLPKKSKDSEEIFPYKGWVEFDLPGFEERADLYEFINVGVPVDGKLEERSEMQKVKEYFKLCKNKITKMSVFKGKKEFTSIDEISRDNNSVLFIYYMGAIILSSVDLGE